ETRSRRRYVSPSRPEPARRHGAGGPRPTDDPPRRALSLGYNSGAGARHRAAGARPVEARRIDRSAHGRNGGRLVRGRIVQISVSRGGVPKTTIEQAHVTALGLEGDAHRDREHHGGPERAVCLYALEAIASLRAEGHDIVPGAIGENVTVEGLDW